MFGPPISWHVLVTKESGRRRMNTSEDLEVGRRKKYSGLLAGCKLQYTMKKILPVRLCDRAQDLNHAPMSPGG